VFCVSATLPESPVSWDSSCSRLTVSSSADMIACAPEAFSHALGVANPRCPNYRRRGGCLSVGMLKGRVVCPWNFGACADLDRRRTWCCVVLWSGELLRPSKSWNSRVDMRVGEAPFYSGVLCCSIQGTTDGDGQKWRSAPRQWARRDRGVALGGTCNYRNGYVGLCEPWHSLAAISANSPPCLVLRGRANTADRISRLTFVPFPVVGCTWDGCTCCLCVHVHRPYVP
jgi:hypothetical protein